MSSRHLDFGSGKNPRNPFGRQEVITLDVDKNLHSLDFRIEPGNLIPFADNYFDSVSAYDVLEHLSRDGRPSHFVLYMNELYRVLKPEGLALFVFPLASHHSFFDDPSHVNPMTLNVFDFFLSSDNETEYEGIDVKYKVVLRQKLRNWNRYVNQPVVLNRELKNQSIRRRLSLLKRDILRIIVPSHGIFIGQK